MFSCEGCAVIYGFPDLVLEAFCGVTCGGLEIVVDEVLYFCLILLGLNYNEGIPRPLHTACNQHSTDRKHDKPVQ